MPQGLFGFAGIDIPAQNRTIGSSSRERCPFGGKTERGAAGECIGQPARVVARWVPQCDFSTFAANGQLLAPWVPVERMHGAAKDERLTGIRAGRWLRSGNRGLLRFDGH